MLKKSYNMRLEALVFLAEMKEVGYSATDTIHRALSIYRKIRQIEAQGGTVCYENNKGQINRLEFL